MKIEDVDSNVMETGKNEQVPEELKDLTPFFENPQLLRQGSINSVTICVKKDASKMITYVCTDANRRCAGEKMIHKRHTDLITGNAEDTLILPAQCRTEIAFLPEEWSISTHLSPLARVVERVNANQQPACRIEDTMVINIKK